jgi:AcrR family transcriptional regulator
MKLFADKGFGATSVADIEVAVGLQPRRGGLYKHFTNKQHLLETAVRRFVEDARAVALELEDLDISSFAVEPSALRGLLVEIGRRFLAEMDRLEELTRVLEHDGSRLPELTAALATDLVDLSYRVAARLISAVTNVNDIDATAVVVLGSLVALRRTEWTFGIPPLAVSDERFLEAWADTLLRALDGSA